MLIFIESLKKCISTEQSLIKMSIKNSIEWLKLQIKPLRIWEEQKINVVLNCL